jgi:putative Mg2+ transporter-C (MgtC) family protein
MPLDVELMLRLLGAAVAGGMIGLEREASDQPAGFRTHMLVALGSCLFTVISAYGFDAFLADQPGPQVRYDPTRIAAQIVTGIGFLGAGAILRYGTTVRGLTTAASLWVVAAIGMAVGAGAYLISLVTTAITILALLALRPLRTRLVRGLKKEHEEFLVDAEPGLEMEQLVHDLGLQGIRIDHFRVEEEDEMKQIVLFLTIPPEDRPEDVVARLSRLPGIRNVDWTR